MGLFFFTLDKAFQHFEGEFSKYVPTEIATSAQQFHTERDARLILVCTGCIGRFVSASRLLVKKKTVHLKYERNKNCIIPIRIMTLIR
jgi:hypothetical protein